MATKQTKRVLTGSRATGMPHLGNYFGAYKPAIDLQDRYELFLFLADFHALNEHNTPDENRLNSYRMVAAFFYSAKCKYPRAGSCKNPFCIVE